MEVEKIALKIALQYYDRQLPEDVHSGSYSIHSEKSYDYEKLFDEECRIWVDIVEHIIQNSPKAYYESLFLCRPVFNASIAQDNVFVYFNKYLHDARDSVSSDIIGGISMLLTSYQRALENSKLII